MTRVLSGVRHLVPAAWLAACSSTPSPSPGPSPAAEPLVLAAGEGESLGEGAFIKVSPKQGSRHLAAGTEVFQAGQGIPVHLHEHEDEILFLHDGAATVIVGERKTPVQRGAMVFIPKGVWHGMEQAADGTQLLWVVTPPLLDSYFRAINEPRKHTDEEMRRIEEKHGIRYRK